MQAILDFLNSEVRPHAAEIDSNPEAMKRAFEGLADRKWLALKRPSEFGGPGICESDFRFFQEEVARASGALAFLQTQHQSAVSLIAKNASPSIQQEYLPEMDSTRTVGLGFSQLRRTGEPICKAERISGGFLISGHVPWITGESYFKEYLIGATLPGGEAVFGLLPLANAEGQTLSEPMQLTAMETARTVTANLDRYFLVDSKVAFVRPAGWIRANDSFNITLQGHFAIGCAMAGVDVVRDNAVRRGLESVLHTADQLEQEVDRCRNALVHASSDLSDSTKSVRLSTRAWSIELMMRCAHAGVISSSGAANQKSHPAGRVLREAIVFSVSAQTIDIMDASLGRLVRSATVDN